MIQTFFAFPRKSFKASIPCLRMAQGIFLGKHSTLQLWYLNFKFPLTWTLVSYTNPTLAFSKTKHSGSTFTQVNFSSCNCRTWIINEGNDCSQAIRELLVAKNTNLTTVIGFLVMWFVSLYIELVMTFEIKVKIFKIAGNRKWYIQWLHEFWLQEKCSLLWIEIIFKPFCNLSETLCWAS